MKATEEAKVDSEKSKKVDDNTCERPSEWIFIRWNCEPKQSFKVKNRTTNKLRWLTANQHVQLESIKAIFISDARNNLWEFKSQSKKLLKIVERTMLRMHFCDCHRENSLNFRKMKSSSHFVTKILTRFIFVANFNIHKYLNDPEWLKTTEN